MEQLNSMCNQICHSESLFKVTNTIVVVDGKFCKKRQK